MRCAWFIRKPSPAQSGLHSPGLWWSLSPGHVSRQVLAGLVRWVPSGLLSGMRCLLCGLCRASPKLRCCSPSAAPPLFPPPFAPSRLRRAVVSRQLARPPAIGAPGVEVGSCLFWLPATHHVVRGAVVITWALLLALRTFFSADSNSHID